MKQRLLVLLYSLGLIVSVYLVFKTHDPSTVICSLGGGCETVLGSQYARIYGVPVAAFGVAWYIIGLLLVWFTYLRRLLPNSYLKMWAIGGLLFSLYLLSLEMFKIHSYCTWCLGSLGVVVLLNIVTFGTRSRTDD